MKLDPLRTHEVRLLPDSLHVKMFGAGNNLLFGRMGVHGDGTCFFHSLCAALNKDDYLTSTSKVQQQIGHHFRCDFNNYITQAKWDKFKAKHSVKSDWDLQELQRRFCDDKHWADETMIKLVSDTLKLNLIFIDTATSKIYCGVRGHKREPLIVILWIDHSHFEPMFRVIDEELDAKKLQVQFVYDLDSDKDVVNSILSSYSFQCSA